MNVKVFGVARNKKKLNLINKGKSPIIEQGLNEIVRKAVENDNLIAIDNGLEACRSFKSL